MMRLFFFLLLALGCALGSAPAQEKQGGGICTKCKNVGRLWCSEHDKNVEEREYVDEDELQYCSVIADCAVCGGTGWVLCPQCKPPEVAQALEKKRALVEKKRIVLKSLDDKMKRPLRKSESEHFQLVWEMEKQKVDKKFISPHQGLHLYSHRLEQMYTDYQATLGCKDKDFAQKQRVLVWYLPSDQEFGATTFCGQTGRGGVRLMGHDGTYSVCGNKQNFQNDQRLHRNIVHNVSHLLLAAQQPEAWIGNQKYGWLDEGLGHWWEDRYWNLCDTYCFQEQNTNTDFKSGHYKLAVRKLIAASEAPPAAEIFQQTSDSLTLPQGAVSMSYVDFLIFKDPTKLLELAKKMKAKVVGRDALQQVYGMNLLDFEAQWKAWVLATYPKQ